ncbi:MAG: hypothetical protein CSA62_03035 [Planctomycetota bacterium]|nr:MAG: hypothetical protein CSA62_03035 [Planctomycetota bacterium]
MPKREQIEVLEERLDELVEKLLVMGRPKWERIRLMQSLVSLGEKLPDEVVEAALARIMERMLD